LPYYWLGCYYSWFGSWLSHSRFKVHMLWIFWRPKSWLGGLDCFAFWIILQNNWGTQKSSNNCMSSSFLLLIWQKICPHTYPHSSCANQLIFTIFDISTLPWPILPWFFFALGFSLHLLKCSVIGDPTLSTAPKIALIPRPLEAITENHNVLRMFDFIQRHPQQNRISVQWMSWEWQSSCVHPFSATTTWSNYRRPTS
jgi:hypothetical protein